MSNKRGMAEPFVKVPLWWADTVFKAAGTPRALICIRLLHLAWKDQSDTVKLSSGWLKRRGISRNTWRRTLQDLEAAGLITVARLRGKAPVVTWAVYPF
jgi:hypothetical protein